MKILLLFLLVAAMAIMAHLGAREQVAERDEAPV
jgi:hypothetical protein